MASLGSTETLTEDWVDVKELAVRPKPKDSNTCLQLYQRLNATAAERLKKHASPIFRVDLDHRQLYSHYVDALPQGLKQQHNCNTCRAFVRRYGGLALIDDSGVLQPLLWDPKDEGLDPVFRPPIAALARQFKERKVLTEFKITPFIKAKMQATAEKGGFHHLYFTCPKERLYTKQTIPGFEGASTPELAKMLSAVIKSYRLATIQRATQILEQDKLPQADNHKAAARWLLDLLEADKIKRNGASDSVARHNLGYRYAAMSFTGCINQLRSGALSTLLDAIEAGHPWDTLEREWKQKTNPTSYLRPQAAPKAGNISASERLFNQFGITKDDLRRRLLVLEDVPPECFLWQSQHSVPKKHIAVKLFANITPKGAQAKQRAGDADLPPTRMTFTKFVTTVLSTAKQVEYKLPKDEYIYFFITGYPNTKPLMHWHFDDNSNRASWYTYMSPNAVKSYNLKPYEWNEVKAIIPFPHLWDGAPTTTTFPLPDDSENFKFYHKKQGFEYLIALDGIVDKNLKGLHLFPTLMKGEFHGARATIEAYSNSMNREVVSHADDKGGYVGGVAMDRSMGKSGSEKKHLLRVTDQKGMRSVYEITLFE